MTLLFRYKRIAVMFLGIAVVAGGFLMPLSEVKAAETSTAGILLNDGMLPYRVGTLVIKTMMSKAISTAVFIVDWVLRLKIVANAPVVASTWSIVRNFSNMFFIVFLIIMAFATIFDLGSWGYGGYDIGSLMGRFLIAALLINFSLVIGQEIIGYTQVVNSAFLNSMGQLSDTVLKDLQPQQLLGNPAPPTQAAINTLGATVATACSGPLNGFMFGALGVGCTVAKYAGNMMNGLPTQIAAQGAASLIATATESPDEYAMAIFQNIMSIVFYGILLFSLLVPIVFGIIRVPFLWFLLIISPLAWLCSVLPSTQHISKYWWKQFWGWNLFLPVYLFFLMIGMAVLKSQDAVMRDLMNAWAENGAAAPAIINTGMTSLQVLFFYTFVGIVLIGGAGAAFKSSFLAGTAAAGAAGWARGAVGRFTGATAIGRAAKQRGERIQKEGVSVFGRKIYSGERGLEDSTARWQARFGDRTAKERLLAKSVKDVKDKLKEGGMSNADLENTFDKGAIPDSVAAGELLMENNRLDLDRMSKLSEHYQKISPAATTAYHDRAEKALNEMAEKGTIKLGSASKVTAMIDKIKSDPADREKLGNRLVDKVYKQNLVAAAELKHQINPASGTVEHHIEEYLKALDAKDIVGQNMDALNSPVLQSVLFRPGFVAARTNLKNRIMITTMTPEKRAIFSRIP